LGWRRKWDVGNADSASIGEEEWLLTVRSSKEGSSGRRKELLTHSYFFTKQRKRNALDCGRGLRGTFLQPSGSKKNGDKGGETLTISLSTHSSSGWEKEKGGQIEAANGRRACVLELGVRDKRSKDSRTIFPDG